jgi:uncharacterized protein (DUF362 family)
MAKTTVSITRTPRAPAYEQIRAAVEKAVELVGGVGEFIKPGQKALVNPSWVSVIPRPA